MHYTLQQTQDFVSMILKMLDYEVKDVTNRLEKVREIEHKYKEEIQARYMYYSNSNLSVMSNRNCLNALNALLDILSEYVLIDDLGDRSKNYPVFKENDLPNTLSTDQTVRLSTVSKNLLKEEHREHARPRIKYSKDTIAKHSFLMQQIEENGLSEEAADELLNTLRAQELYFYTDYLRSCPYIVDYLKYETVARKIIEDKEWKGVPLTPQELKRLKKAIGYRKHNSIEIDRDIIAVARFYFGFISFQRIHKGSLEINLDRVDLLNKNHIKALLQFPNGKIDKFHTDYGLILYEIDSLIRKAGLNDFECDVLELYRYHDMTQEKIATYMNVSQPYISQTIDIIARKCFHVAEKEYEDWYYLNVEKGMYKQCKVCGEIKLVLPRYFQKDSKGTDGYKAVCKKCANAIKLEGNQKKSKEKPSKQR